MPPRCIQKSRPTRVSFRRTCRPCAASPTTSPRPRSFTAAAPDGSHPAETRTRREGTMKTSHWIIAALLIAPAAARADRADRLERSGQRLERGGERTEKRGERLERRGERREKRGEALEHEPTAAAPHE